MRISTIRHFENVTLRLYMYEQGTDVSRYGMSLVFIRTSGFLLANKDTMRKAKACHTALWFRNFKKYLKKRETTKTSCNCQKHFWKSLRHDNSSHSVVPALLWKTNGRLQEDIWQTNRREKVYFWSPTWSYRKNRARWWPFPLLGADFHTGTFHN